MGIFLVPAIHGSALICFGVKTVTSVTVLTSWVDFCEGSIVVQSLFDYFISFSFFFRKRTEQTVGVSQMYDNFPLLVFPTALQTDEQLGYVSKILETRAAWASWSSRVDNMNYGQLHYNRRSPDVYKCLLNITRGVWVNRVLWTFPSDSTAVAQWNQKIFITLHMGQPICHHAFLYIV
jgi:hypothetical protein